jgi:hypothetical protein
VVTRAVAGFLPVALLRRDRILRSLSSRAARSGPLPFQALFASFCGLMNILRFSDPGYEQQLDKLVSHSSLFDSGIEDRTRAIVNDVRSN